MNKCLGVILCLILAACSSDKHVDYPRHTGDYYQPITTEKYYDENVSFNSNITGVISRNEKQVSEYVTNRLQRYKVSDEDAAKSITKMDVANAALEISRDPEKIKQMYNTDFELLRQAMFITDFQLVAQCMRDSNAADAAACYTKWRSTNQKSINTLLKNAQVLNVADITFDASDGSKLKFTVDEYTGKITDISVTEDGDTTDYKQYSGASFYANNGKQKLNYTSYGRNVGLSYADFGYYMTTDTQPDDSGNKFITTVTKQPTIFVGGYDSREIATANIAQDITFSGTAVGNVVSTKEETEKRLLTEGHATLNFTQENQTTTLAVDCNNWYDIVVITDKNGNSDIHLENYKGNTSDYDMKLISAPDDNGAIHSTNVNMNTQWYGPNPDDHTPSEAVGTVQFTDCGGGTCGANDPSVKLDMAFGVK